MSGLVGRRAERESIVRARAGPSGALVVRGKAGIGRNSSGKASFIEAIRLLTEPLDGLRTRYLSREDLFRRPGAEWSN